MAKRRKESGLVDDLSPPGPGVAKAASSPGAASVHSMSGSEFELLVGEVFRRRRYQVEEGGGRGPDGGVDLIARRGGETALVQCKHWRTKQVGVGVVRELLGSMTALDAKAGAVVTSLGGSRSQRSGSLRIRGLSCSTERRFVRSLGRSYQLLRRRLLCWRPRSLQSLLLALRHSGRRRLVRSALERWSSAQHAAAQRSARSFGDALRIRGAEEQDVYRHILQLSEVHCLGFLATAQTGKALVRSRVGRDQ